MTDVTAAKIAGEGVPRLTSPLIAGIKCASEALRALKTVAREGRLTDEAAVRGIAMRADALQPGCF